MKFIFENFSREVDNMDIEVVKRYEKGLEEFYRRVARIDMKKCASGIYEDIYMAGAAMLDGFFGEGSAGEMFAGAKSVRKVMTAICALNSYMNDVGGVIEEMRGLGA